MLFSASFRSFTLKLGAQCLGDFSRDLEKTRGIYFSGKQACVMLVWKPKISVPDSGNGAGSAGLLKHEDVYRPKVIV